MIYTHPDRVDVAVGDLVSEDQQVGLSGDSGCIGMGRLTHLHVELRCLVGSSPASYWFPHAPGWARATLISARPCT